MWDEDDLGAALRAELAQRTPPTPRSGLVDTVARGRRRRRRQQFGAALAVVAAVAGVATVVVSAAALPFGGQDVAATGTTSTEASWPRADLPAHSPHTTWTPAPTAPPPVGWSTGPVPRCEIPDVTGRDLDSVRADLSALQQVWQALAEVAEDATVGLLGELKLLTAADEQAYDMGNCQPPKRHVLADGTVLQIYDVAPSDPFASLNQTLRIYLPDGQLYSLSVRNFGSPDFATNREDPGHPHRVGAGRPTLPLTERQLAELGLAMVG